VGATVLGVPLTEDGQRRLAAELGHADLRLDPPALVWLYDPDTLVEARAALHGWRTGPLRYALIVQHLPGGVDRVAWVCEPYVRPRRE
jgi:hypothetical protein